MNKIKLKDIRWTIGECDRHVPLYNGEEIRTGYKEFTWDFRQDDPYLVEAYRLLKVEPFSADPTTPEWITFEILKTLRDALQELAQDNYSVEFPDEMNLVEYEKFINECRRNDMVHHGSKEPSF